MPPDLHETHEVHTHPSIAVIVSICREKSDSEEEEDGAQQHEASLTVFRVWVFLLRLHSRTQLGSSLLIRR